MNYAGFIASIAFALAFLVITTITPSYAETNRDSWRYDAHSRSIDIDICIRCTSDVPGPQGPPGPPGPPGPQGPPGDTHQTIVTLHDDAEGNAAGWNPSDPIPGAVIFLFTIQSPVDLEAALSIEMTWVNAPHSPGQHVAGHCVPTDLNTSTDRFGIGCISAGLIPTEGSTLTYIITKSET